MKVLHVIASMDPALGGPMQGVRSTITTIKQHGLQSHNEVVCLDDPTADYVVNEGFPIHALGRASGLWRRNPALSAWLRENLARYDSVIIHGLWLYHSYAVTKAVRRLRATGVNRQLVFVMPHGMLDPWFQKHPSRRIKAIRNWFYWKLIEEQTIGQADGILFTCQRELELARTTFRPYRPRREINIGYGVTVPPDYHEGMCAAFHQQIPELRERPYLLYLSRIHPKKGIDLLIRAHARLGKARRQAGLSTPGLVVAGPLDSPYAKSMQELARSESLKHPSQSDPSSEAVVYFPGMLSGDAKWGAFYGCEAFVLPSHQENFGIAVVEALACGKPVLISDQVNICEEIERAGAGLVESDDSQGTESLLSRFLELSESSKSRMSSSASECYRACFGPEAAALRLLDALSPGKSPDQSALVAVEQALTP